MVHGLVGKFYDASEIIMKIVLFQFLWLAFTLCGFIIFSIVPATVSLYSVVRKWMTGTESNRTLIKAYWDTFRKEFLRANAIGIILISICFLIYLNFSIIRLTEGFIHFFFMIILYMISILFLIMLLYIFPIYVHYNLKMSQYFSMAILVGISFPFHTVFKVLGFVGLYYLFLWVPGLIPFFSTSLPCILITWVSFKVFKTIERKQEETQETILEKFHQGMITK